MLLERDDAEKLFRGLEVSADENARDIGVIGSKLNNVDAIIYGLDSINKNNRLEAYENLTKEYSDNLDVINKVISLLEMPYLDKLTPSGRVNALSFLNSTPIRAWDLKSIGRAEKAISLILERGNSGLSQIGNQTQDLINKLKLRLSEAKGK